MPTTTRGTFRAWRPSPWLFTWDTICKEAAVCLLSHKADLDAETLGGHTPLMIAFEKNRFDLALLLIEKGPMSTT